MTDELRHATPADWFAFAERDLAASKVLNEAGLYPYVCYHAQQAVEKALKGWLVHIGQRVPKIHNLRKLADLNEQIRSTLEPHHDALVFLNQFYSPVRYPDLFPGTLAERLPDKADAERAVQRAEEVVNVVKGKLESQK
jgi:HEPN domain-containing protein